MSWWSFIPLWAWLVLGGFVALAIYFFILNDHSRSIVWRLIKAYGFFIILAVIYLLMRHYWGFFETGDWFTRKANAYCLLILAGYLIGREFLGKVRYKSTQAICDNRSGACAEYQDVGKYVVLKIGSTDWFIPWEWGHETWVVPKRHFNKINEKPNASKTQIKIKTNVTQCDLNEVPPKCRDYIETTFGYSKEDVYYGEFSLAEIKSGLKIKDEKSGKTLEPTEFENKLKDTQRLLNESRQMLKGKTSAIRGFVSDADTIRKKAGGRSALAPTRPEGEYQ